MIPTNMYVLRAQELHDSLPSDPFEADVLKMAEAVAEASSEPDHSERKCTYRILSFDKCINVV
jgi:hypothetical protein